MEPEIIEEPIIEIDQEPEISLPLVDRNTICEHSYIKEGDNRAYCPKCGTGLMFDPTTTGIVGGKLVQGV